MVTFGLWTFLWTLLNVALIILGVVFLVYGILAFRKYIKVDTAPSTSKTPEEG